MSKKSLSLSAAFTMLQIKAVFGCFCSYTSSYQNLSEINLESSNLCGKFLQVLGNLAIRSDLICLQFPSDNKIYNEIRKKKLEGAIPPA